MRKLIYGVLSLVIVFSAGLFTACGKEETYHEDTLAKIETFLENEENQFLFGPTPGITYKTGIQNEIDTNNPAYLELNTMYFEILNSLTYMFKSTHSNLEITPIYQEEETKQAFENFALSIDNLQVTINTFKQDKEAFEDNVIANFEQSHALQELKEFKRNYTKLINETANFNQSFENLYLTAYVKLPTAPIEEVSTGMETLIGNTTINQLLNSYIKYTYDNSDNTMRVGEYTSILNKVSDIEQAIANPIIKENNLELVNTFIEHKQAFAVEKSQFFESLDIVNLDEYSANAELYLETYPEQEAYVTKINQFMTTAVSIYSSKVLQLLN